MTFTLGTPQIIYLILTFLGLVLSVIRHETPKEGTHNVWADITATAIVFGILYWGGFFG
jgi:hypothetical protein